MCSPEAGGEDEASLPRAALRHSARRRSGRPCPLAGGINGGRLPVALAAIVAAATGAVHADAFASADVLSTKVWLDQHLFNSTLKTTKLEDGSKVWLMNEAKARDAGLAWPPESWPTLCFLGLGASSIEYLAALAQLFPELQLALMDVKEQLWLDKLADTLGDAISRVALADIDDFAEDRGPSRRTCHAISWSVDTPPFSFYKYRELFYSSPYVLALFNMQGCTSETRHERADARDKFYCEYLHSSFQSTLCGKVGDDKSVHVYEGKDLYFPQVDAGCGELICMCHAHSDAYLDFHFEHLCRRNQEEHEHRFMGQWGQDEFIFRNLFKSNAKRGRGIYVDVGASHPFHLSNTAYFDSCLGWNGLCLEPNPRFNSILKAHRGCEVVSACAWSKSAKLRFANGGELAAMTEDEDLVPTDPYDANDGNRTKAGGNFFEARCAPLHDLLIEGLSSLIRHKGRDAVEISADERPTIDLISVDAEGAEIDIFRDFPFEAWKIHVIVVEVSRRSCMAIDSLLLPAGFIKLAVLGKDAVYVSREIMAQVPAEGVRLPKRIQWNEPGTDKDTIEYLRFQRYFGVSGDLDDEVGDQRLHNETELEKQHNRTEERHRATMERLLTAASNASFGGVLSEEERKAMELPEVQELLRDPQVKAVMKLDTAAEIRRAASENVRLRSRLARLHQLGALTQSWAAEIAAEEEASSR